MSVWMARNEQFHKTDRIKDLEGQDILNKAIKEEHAIGLSWLPAYSFSWMFMKKENEMMKESNDTMRNWLGMVKQGWIVHKNPIWFKNKFYNNGALKKSLDLVEYTDEELM